MWPAGPNYAEDESNASLLAIAEAQQYMWPAGPNCAEDESNASLLAIAEAQQYMWPAGPNCAEAERNASLACNCLRRNSICKKRSNSNDMNRSLFNAGKIPAAYHDMLFKTPRLFLSTARPPSFY